MEDLFSTSLSVNHQSVVYRVIFDQEKYVFLSQGEQSAYPSFSFRREHDEWQDQDPVPPEIKKQALDALDRYLMKQH